MGPNSQLHSYPTPSLKHKEVEYPRTGTYGVYYAITKWNY